MNFKDSDLVTFRPLFFKTPKMVILIFISLSSITVAVDKVQRDGAHSDSVVIYNDFETGLGSWEISFDGMPDTKSLGWTLDDFGSSINELAPAAPKPPTGSKYLRLFSPSFGIAELKSPKVFVSPGDQLSVTHWIQSKYKTFDNLEAKL